MAALFRQFVTETALSLLLMALLRGVQARLDEDAVALAGDLFGFFRVAVVTPVACSKEDSMLVMKSLHQWMVPVPLEVAVRQAGPYRLGVLIDYDCVSSKATLDKSSTLQLMNGSYSWLIWSERSPPDDHLDVRLDSEVTWATGRPVQLYDLHKAGADLPVNVTRAGSWERNQGLSYQLERFKYNRRNLRGRNVGAGIVITRTPLDNLEKRLLSSKNNYQDIISKYNYALSINLQDMYNFSLELLPTTSWGYLKADGKTFDGVLGMLQTGKAEFGLSSCIIKKYRTRHFDFVGSSWVFRSCIMFRQPATMGLRGVLFMPFTTSVWFLSAVLFSVITLLLRFQHWAEHRWRCGPGNTEDSWSATVIFTVGSVSQQGTTSDSDWLSWRMMILFTSVMALMFDTYYSAAVVTSLLLPPPKTIRNKRNLIDSPLNMGIENMSYTMDYFQKTTDPLGKELFHKKVLPPGRSNPMFLTVAEGVERIRTHVFAFHAEDVSMMPLIANTFSESDICALSSMPLFPHAMTEHSVLKGSPLREMLTVGLRAAWERGHRDRHEKVWRPRRPPCVDSGEAVSVGIIALSPAFLLLLLGILVSLVMLLGERYRNKKMNK